MDQQGKLEIQREKIESQLKQEFENTRQRFQLEIAKLQTTLKSELKKSRVLFLNVYHYQLPYIFI
jgi:hypothetical protein